ncbi:MAG: DUF3365 domain-containing protein [Cyanobacteria bacterium P01_D01_bin.156]
MSAPAVAAIQSRSRQRAITVVILCLFIASITLGGWALAHTLQRGVRIQYVQHDAEILMNMVNSVREYTSSQIRPALAHQAEAKFWPESVPSYSAQQVFERLRQQPKYSHYSYKEAVLNPTSLNDKANPFEKQLIEQFRNSEIPRNKQLNGYTMTPKGKLFYSAKAISVSKPSCLQCHSTPDVAPNYIVEHYGTANGFGWQLNEVVGAQMLYLPMKSLQYTNHSLLSRVMVVFIAVLACCLLLLRFWLRTA